MDSGFVELSLNALAERWWMWVVRGVAAIILGIIAFFMPQITLAALVIVWGVYAIFDGVFDLGLAAYRGSTGQRWGWPFFEGLVGIAAGIVTFAWPGITAFVLLIVIAVWAVLTGVFEIGAAISLRRYLTGEWLLALTGILSIAFGVLLLARPGTGALALAYTLGAYALAFGVVLIGLGLRLNRWKKGERPAPMGGASTTAVRG